jgi:hypothetical protein
MLIWMHERNTIKLHVQVFLGARSSAVRHCATSRKVAGSIPDGVIGIFYCHNPSGRTMPLGLPQALTETMYSSENIDVRNCVQLFESPCRILCLCVFMFLNCEYVNRIMEKIDKRVKTRLNNTLRRSIIT